MTRIAAILWILSIAGAQAASAPNTEKGANAPKVLRYVSQRPEKAYPQFDTWRRVRTVDGTLGWMNASMLSDKRTVLITGKGRVKITADAQGGKMVALADPGAIANLRSCTREACRIKGEQVDGWVSKSRIWGVGDNEIFDNLPRRR
jgi:hypothetical protein